MDWLDELDDMTPVPLPEDWENGEYDPYGGKDDGLSKVDAA